MRLALPQAGLLLLNASPDLHHLLTLVIRDSARNVYYPGEPLALSLTNANGEELSVPRFLFSIARPETMCKGLGNQMTRKRTIRPGGSRGTLFESVARLRLEDAAVLLKNGRFSGAIYLAGYGIECLLKSAVTRRRNLIYLPAEFETHDWERLLSEAGLGPRLAEEPAVERSFRQLAGAWAPELRYLAKPMEPASTKHLYENMAAVYGWIRENSV